MDALQRSLSEARVERRASQASATQEVNQFHLSNGGVWKRSERNDLPPIAAKSPERKQTGYEEFINPYRISEDLPQSNECVHAQRRQRCEPSRRGSWQNRYHHDRYGRWPGCLCRVVVRWIPWIGR